MKKGEEEEGREICFKCNKEIKENENYTVIVCCQIRCHAGCIHRKFISGIRSCPKCNKEPKLSFIESPINIPSRFDPKKELISNDNNDSIISKFFNLLIPSNQIPFNKSIHDLLKEGWTWEMMKEKGMTENQLLINHGLNLSIYRQNRNEIIKYFNINERSFF